jgi:hypothetical protein
VPTENTVKLTLTRGDYERINNTLGHLANLAGMVEIEPADAATYLRTISATMPPAEARRLVDELDRQAQGVTP